MAEVAKIEDSWFKDVYTIYVVTAEVFSAKAAERGEFKYENELKSDFSF